MKLNKFKFFGLFSLPLLGVLAASCTTSIPKEKPTTLNAELANANNANIKTKLNVEDLVNTIFSANKSENFINSFKETQVPTQEWKDKVKKAFEEYSKYSLKNEYTTDAYTKALTTLNEALSEKWYYVLNNLDLFTWRLSSVNDEFTKNKFNIELGEEYKAKKEQFTKTIDFENKPVETRIKDNTKIPANIVTSIEFSDTSPLFFIMLNDTHFIRMTYDFRDERKDVTSPRNDYGKATLNIVAFNFNSTNPLNLKEYQILLHNLLVHDNDRVFVLDGINRFKNLVKTNGLFLRNVLVKFDVDKIEVPNKEEKANTANSSDGSNQRSISTSSRR